MNHEFFDAKELVELTQFKSYLDKLEIKAFVLPKSGTDDISVLTIELTKDLSLSILFIPLPSDQFKQISLLQFYALINEKVDVSKLNLNSLLNHISEKTALGNFAINSDNELVFKYVLTKSKHDELSEIFFIELLAIIVPSIESNYTLLNEFLQDNFSIEEAISSIE